MDTQEQELPQTSASDEKLDVILLTGQSGVGKTVTAYEISAILKMRSIKHALIDTDELDRIYPAPADPEKLTEQNLKFIWNGFAELGCNKLILCAVLAEAEGVPGWIKRTLPDDQNVHIFRLKASRDIVVARLKKREVGSLLEQHLQSSSRAAAIISEKSADIPIVTTEGKSVNDVALEILQSVKWI